MNYFRKPVVILLLSFFLMVIGSVFKIYRFLGVLSNFLIFIGFVGVVYFIVRFIKTNKLKIQELKYSFDVLIVLNHNAYIGYQFFLIPYIFVICCLNNYYNNLNYDMFNGCRIFIKVNYRFFYSLSSFQFRLIFVSFSFFIQG